MKIRVVECLVREPHYLFVKIQTDEGLVGIGECCRGHRHATQAVVEDVLAPVIIGAHVLETSIPFEA